MKYNDLDAAVRNCLKLVNEFGGDFDISDRKDDGDDNTEHSIIFLGKTDLSSAFRVLPLKISCFCWLIFKAEDPETGETMFFVEKCLPFRASISCSHYQRFSNALKFLLEKRMARMPGKGKALTNYLDDLLFIAIAKWICNQMIREFLNLCARLCIPVALEKTEWATSTLIFLGILLNGRI